MPEFIMPTNGSAEKLVGVPPVVQSEKQVFGWITWRDLDAFTQGYIEAMFFTETGSGDDGELEHVTFGDLAPETLAAVIADCAKFRDDAAIVACIGNDDEKAGRDFWYTRNGHGCGFWDGDWPEPDSDYLDLRANDFPQVDLYIGDDGKVYAA